MIFLFALCFFAPFLHGKSEKREKFCRIFMLMLVQKYIIRVYF